MCSSEPTEGEDYVYHGPPITFNTALSSQICVNITIINDQFPESSETMKINIAVVPTGRDNIMLQQMAIIEIVDDFGKIQSF